MSWPLASFLIVALVLAAGWIAYERRRPSARIAAVVAVMAALAALGRDAFAALPDVKPITAITLVTGYALGPLPGFTVGALGMLVSNFMLGQGPYTPWQMAAWGMVGLVGASIGGLSRRRMGRVQLACACAFAALAAKEVMNAYTWTLGASHTPAAFLLIAGQALAYDVTDMVASFAFGLAFAPELARVLTRTRVRMQVAWEPDRADRLAAGAAAGRSGALAAALAALAVGAALIAGAPRATAASSTSSRASEARATFSRELAFLAGAQNGDGGFGGARGQASSELYTAWAAIGIAAAGRDPLAFRRGGHTVLDALRGESGSLQGAGDLERTILALHACGVSVRSLPGGDPVRRLLRYRSADGSFGHLSNLTAFGVLALRAAGYRPGDPAVSAAAGWLARQQNRDGGFGFAARSAGAPDPSDIDDTAAALQALVVAGRSGQPALARASAFLSRSQNLDGGFPQQPGGSSNAQSTAWAVQGLTAAGRDPATVRRSRSRSPLAYLGGLVAANGSVRYSPTGSQTPVWVTAQALTALAGKPLPIAPVDHRARVAAAPAVPGARPHRATPRRRAAAAGAPAPRSAAATGASLAIGAVERAAQAIAALVGSIGSSAGV